MNEKLLQYLWNFKIFTHFDFKDIEGNDLHIIDFGKWNFDSGPDFLFAKIKTKGILLAGNIELHVKSSDWIFHRHSGNPEFDNVILHVVFNHDIDLEEFEQKNIPTLALKNYVNEKLLSKYETLMQETQFIPCEKLFQPSYIPLHFHEENLLKKLDEASLKIEHQLTLHQNNYEAVLFHQLAYAFGLKVNADIFHQLASSVDYVTFNKIRQNPTQVEALLFGLCNWLEHPADEQTKIWKREFEFLKAKFKLPAVYCTPKFSKLRPPNFPTLRLSQLANLYHQHQNLFSKLIMAKSVAEIHDLFSKVQASSYWNNRFNFGKISPVNGVKNLSRDFVELLLINAILPLKYTYLKNTQEEIVDELFTWYEGISPEKNSIIENWQGLNVKCRNALETQSLLFHYKNKCLQKDCLKCSIGLQIMNK